MRTSRDKPSYLITCLAAIVCSTLNSSGGAAACEINAINFGGNLFDSLYTQRWSSDGVHRNNILTALNVGKGNWNGDWGALYIGDDRYFLTRFINAAHLVWEFQAKGDLFHPFPFSLEFEKIWGTDPESGSTIILEQGLVIKENSPSHFQSWEFLCEGSSNGWTPSCMVDKLGRNPTDFDFYGLFTINDGPIILGYKFAYNLTQTEPGLTVAERAGTLLHEATHQNGYRHVCNNCDLCLRRRSCDDTLGRVNANTIQAFFLMDLLGTFYVDEKRNPIYEVYLDRQRGGQWCRVRQYLTKDERYEVFRTASDIILRGFEASPYHYMSLLEYIYERSDDLDNKPISCDVCNTDDYLWSNAQGQIGKYACPEYIGFMAEKSHATNALNSELCNQLGKPEINSNLEDVSDNRAALRLGLKECPVPTEADYQAYCAAQVGSATKVDDIDIAGYLINGRKFPCIQQFCQERFDSGWKTLFADWRTFDDPLGCANAICGPLSLPASEKARSDLCRRSFLEFDGDPARYLAFDEVDHCKEDYLLCYFSSKDTPLPSKNWVRSENCPVQSVICKRNQSKVKDIFWEEISARYAVPQEQPPDPEEIGPFPDPTESLRRRQFVDVLSDLVEPDAGSKQFFDALMKSPDFHARLFTEMPEAYIAISGENKALRSIVSPQRLEGAESRYKGGRGLRGLRGLRFRSSIAEQLFAKLPKPAGGVEQQPSAVGPGIITEELGYPHMSD